MNAAGTDQLVRTWLAQDADAASRAVVQQLQLNNDLSSLHEILAKRLEFGTAGLRGLMGPGYNRMNPVTVQQTSQGLCRYLEQQSGEHLRTQGVVVGYDGRHMSRHFAELTAAVFLSRGVPVALFGGVCPTPFVAAGVAVLGAAAGVMVTASHNPKQYNGYKVYWANGCQIIPPHDLGIAVAIDQNLDLWELPALQSVASHPLCSDPTAVVEREYYSRLQKLRVRPPSASDESLPVVYTPLHGVGLQPLETAFKVFGLPPPVVVEEQARPDPEFPTVTFPNPEEGRETWSLAFRTGERVGARLVLANDPDADRLAVAESSPSSSSSEAGLRWRAFSGNEIGALLAWWVWKNTRKAHPEVPPSQYVMLASAVSSKLLAAMAAKEGFRFVETLTGFKWLGNVAVQEEAQGRTVLMAFEEAIGFMLGGMFKDKDGISAAAVFAELAREVYGSGSSLEAQLAAIYDEYGYFDYRSSYFISDNPSTTRAVFTAMANDGAYPQVIAGEPVRAVRDLGRGYDSAAPDHKPLLPWLPSDMMITFTLQGGAVLTLRASGTEPKLKYYLEVADADREAAKKLADKIQGAIAEELLGATLHGLKPPTH